jgi:N6-adenosine-specific RNA methylase IME4
MDVLTHGLTSILRVHAAPISTSPSLSPFKLNANVDSLPNANANTNPNQKSLAAIWITNAAKSRRAAYTALTGAGFRVCEEWVWVKITGSGHPISDLEGVWRKPYEILVIGSRDGGANVNVDDVDLGVVGDGVAMRRVIAAVPDLHSRKPCLKGLFEEVFFGKSRYSALEVFARNLTAGWWAVGNEVLRFNARECWVGGDGNWNLE